MNESRILNQNRLTFIKDVSHFTNYDTRIMKLIPPQNSDDIIDIFDNGEENRFFFALYTTDSKTDINFFREESESLQLLEHPSINKLIGISSNLNSISAALYKEIPYFTIASKLSSLNHTQKIIILYGVASALKYFQSNNIFFYNLNTSQMYLNKESEPILDGYGFSCFQPPLSEISFVPPELLTYIDHYKHLHNNNIDEESNKLEIDMSKANVYSFGYFMIEILTERKPVLLRRSSDRYFYSYPNNLSKQYHSIISNCINFKPEDRLSFDDILLKLQEVVDLNDGISYEFFKMYTSKFENIHHLSISLPVFNYPLSCFIKQDEEDQNDNLIDEFNLNSDDKIENNSNPNSETNSNINNTKKIENNSNQNSETNSNINNTKKIENNSNQNSETNSNINNTKKIENNSNQNSEKISNINNTEKIENFSNQNSEKNSKNTVVNNKTKNVKIIENENVNSEDKQITMPSIGMPKVRYRQHPDQAKSARLKQINGQIYYDSRNQGTFRYIPNSARPLNSLNLAQMYTRGNSIFSCKSGNTGTNGSGNIPLLSFREFQSRMFPQEQTPNISFINSENDIEILKKRNDPDSQYILGYYYETKDRFEEAFELYKNASVRGHSQALYREGLLLLNGRGCKQNMKKASKLFLQSAKQRNTDAAYHFILIHGKRNNNNNQVNKNNNKEEFEIKMPKEPNTTRSGKSARRNLRKSDNQTETQKQKQAQSARIEKKPIISEKTEANQEENDDSEVNNFTIDSSSSSNSTVNNSQESGEVDIENELRICTNYLQYSADIGFADSIFKLAILHEQGINYDKDLNRAFTLYKRAADRGATEACYRTATMMLEGRGTPRAFNEAAFYLQKAARKGHSDAIFKCGQLFESGLGVTKNVEKAAEFYKEAASKGHIASKRSYARIIHDISKQDQKKNIKNKERSKMPQNENNETHYTPIVNDEKLSFKLMKEAAEAGDNEALSELGEMYRDGFGTQRNLKNAFQCFKKASSLQFLFSNSRSSSVSSSSSSSFNNITTENEVSFSSQSFSIEKKNGLNDHFVLNNNSFYNDIVNKNSNINNIDNVNLIFSSSSTPSFSYSSGCSYSEDYLESSESSPSFNIDQKPSSRACVNLGLMYEQGLATQIDLKKAARYFKISAEMRDPVGQFHYARALENGVGVPVDVSQAAKFYRLSANQGFNRAQFNIARYLEFGLGIQQDKSLAIQFYKCAARQGIKAAEVALKRLKPNCL